MQTVVDLNCDLGESYGAYELGMDEQVIKLISSANVACGFHGGDPSVMNRTVELAHMYGVGVGAHPGYPDLMGFGRRFMDMDRDEFVTMIIYQIGALQAFCTRYGIAMQHIKLHGALGNIVDVDETLANYAAEALMAVNSKLPIFVKPNSMMHKVAVAQGLKPIMEVYADRAYNDDLTLVSRKLKGAVITDPGLAARRVLRILTEGKVQTLGGYDADIQADTICVHGDTKTALEMIRAIRQHLAENGIAIKRI